MMKKINNLLRYQSIYLLVLIFMLISCSKVEIEKISYEYEEGKIWLTKWKDDKKAVVMLEFDDSTPGQASLAIPAMNERNMIGTFYMNPGREGYLNNLNTWQNVAPAGGHELANHTMTHTGASTMEEIVYEVGEASKIIWQIRKQEIYGSLIAFNRGGGTSWNEEDLGQVLIDFFNIDRESKIGVPVTALTVLPGSNAGTMYSIIPKAIEDGNIARLHFHGISSTNGNPPKDYGNGAVWINEFEALLDKLGSVKSDVWIAGFIQVYKYIKEKQSASIIMSKINETQYSVDFQTDLDSKYYNEPLTIIACLPLDWAECNISYNGTVKSEPVNSGFVIFDALPDKGEILLIKK